MHKLSHIGTGCCTGQRGSGRQRRLPTASVSSGGGEQGRKYNHTPHHHSVDEKLRATAPPPPPSYGRSYRKEWECACRNDGGRPLLDYKGGLGSLGGRWPIRTVQRRWRPAYRRWPGCTAFRAGWTRLLCFFAGATFRGIVYLPFTEGGTTGGGLGRLVGESGKVFLWRGRGCYHRRGNWLANRAATIKTTIVRTVDSQMGTHTNTHTSTE